MFNTITLSIIVNKGVLLRNFSIMSQDQFFIFLLYIFVINYELLGKATSWANECPWA